VHAQILRLWVMTHPGSPCSSFSNSVYVSQMSYAEPSMRKRASWHRAKNADFFFFYSLSRCCVWTSV